MGLHNSPILPLLGHMPVPIPTCSVRTWLVQESVGDLYGNNIFGNPAIPLLAEYLNPYVVTIEREYLDPYAVTIEWEYLDPYAVTIEREYLDPYAGTIEWEYLDPYVVRIPM